MRPPLAHASLIRWSPVQNAALTSVPSGAGADAAGARQPATRGVPNATITRYAPLPGADVAFTNVTGGPGLRCCIAARTAAFAGSLGNGSRKIATGKIGRASCRERG